MSKTPSNGMRLTGFYIFLARNRVCGVTSMQIKTPSVAFGATSLNFALKRKREALE